MNSLKDKKSLIIVGVLLLVVVFLGGVMGFLYGKYEKLEDKYESLYGDYERYDDDFNEDIHKPLEENTINPQNYIVKSEILKIALNDLNITEKDIYDLDIELENKPRYKTVVYEVSFDYNYFEYEYYIDALTGKILDSFKSRD